MAGPADDIDRDELVGLLCELIAVPSVNPPGDELPAARVLMDHFQRCGLPAEFVQREGNRTNLICRVPGRSPDGRTLILTSHLDVVPVDDRDEWESDPFDAAVRNDRVIGRGACDAKGPLAAMACALVTIARRGARLDGDLVFLAVYGEEKRGLGSKAAVAAGIRADAAVIGEPTRNRIRIGHPGRLQAAITVEAPATHPTAAGFESNSITAMGRFLAYLGECSDGITEEIKGASDSGRLVPFRIRGGRDDVLSPPQRTQTSLSLWFGHPTTHDRAIDVLESRLADFARATGVNVSASYHRGAMAAGVAAEEAIVQHAIDAVKRVGSPADVSQFPASCDMYVFCHAGIPSIILGPGRLEDAHAANESVGIDELGVAAGIYAEMAGTYLAG